ncbi:putative coatomer zeta subunit [Leptomonas pyrrhocoris]|uniref:Coatomer subunit zeta n=1 Tax=Leptomonas pyrrhocoris TaxID=157538 RepID=A0A0N0DZZ1_LEPPY|nr:putative coatomer zeta subunit [Leptomonas pyrrhocoris]KPA85852.1 putative coatomer zeta subunit [Leptomonas pyrrhocoris]|eukprot:XP_015664291.1 putative coatomer zeta subunit [Leptomonas pyrrhocoris]
MERMAFLHRVQAVIVLDSNESRVFTKYFVGEDTPESSKALAPLEKQRALEHNIFQAIHDFRNRTHVTYESEILVVDGHVVVFHVGEDVTVIVMGAGNENELVLCSVLTGLVDALKQELNVPSLTNRVLLENYCALLMTVDEMLDEGIILETESEAIATSLEPYLIDKSNETARAAISKVNKYLQDNL